MISNHCRGRKARVIETQIKAIIQSFVATEGLRASGEEEDVEFANVLLFKG